jgi:hypothetical protein
LQTEHAEQEGQYKMLAGQEIKQFDAGITHALELQGSAWTAQNQEILALRDDDAQKMLNALQMVRNFCSILVQFLADDIALSGWTATKTILITEMPSIYSIIFPSRVARSPLPFFYQVSLCRKATLQTGAALPTSSVAPTVV